MNLLRMSFLTAPFVHSCTPDGPPMTSSNSMNGLPPVSGAAPGKLPQLNSFKKESDLGKRVRVDPGSDQAADLQQAVSAALAPNGLPPENGLLD